MSFQEKTYFKIEAYLSGQLEAGELYAFEEEIATNDLLKSEIEKHKLANALIVEQRLLSVKNILQEERIKDSNSKPPFNPLAAVVLAVVTIGIGSAVLFFNKEDNATSAFVQEKASTEFVNKNSFSQSESKGTVKKHADNEKGTSYVLYTPVENGFHKHQIQQVEEHIHVDDMGVLFVDTVSQRVSKVQEPSILSNGKKPTEKTVIAADLCATVSIQASINATPTCSHDDSGDILVYNIQGGKKPYSVSLTSSSSEEIINGKLSKGIYQASISDGNGCIKKYPNIAISEKDCPRDYSFNPFFANEEWYIAPHNTDGKLEIYDKGGVLYYQNTLPAFVALKWSGIGIHNQTIPGYYIFVIKYTDGTVQRGSVTIVQ